MINSYSYKPEARIGLRSSELKKATKQQLGITTPTQRIYTSADVITSESPLTFGIELEIDRTDWNADMREACGNALNAITDQIYLKRDGSIDNGIEIVTHPCTLDYHTYSMSWKHICKTARKHGFGALDTCGLHIHVGRAQLGADSAVRNAVIAKTAVLLHCHRTKVIAFTRRNPENLNQWAQIRDLSPAGLCTDEQERITRVLRIISHGSYNPTYVRRPVANTHSERYQALNCENAATVEFRIFRSTLERDEIIASLQFVTNLIRYAQTHSLSECWDSAWADVMGVKHYRELDAYLTAKGLAA